MSNDVRHNGVGYIVVRIIGCYSISIPSAGKVGPCGTAIGVGIGVNCVAKSGDIAKGGIAVRVKVAVANEPVIGHSP
ncbi:hypothetical protein SDC9_100242 [bioreactor metagenome]|uniref:Uncharacterized protein n=1 Tax=bioreactor metagenome TaxID=1076179 RepID=A0A645AV95_9ZZZZ